MVLSPSALNPYFGVRLLQRRDSERDRTRLAAGMSGHHPYLCIRQGANLCLHFVVEDV